MAHSNWPAPGPGQQTWQGGHQWQPPTVAGGGGWHQQGAWHQQQHQQQPSLTPGPPAGSPMKKVLGILVAVCVIALGAFVALLLFADRDPGYDFEDYEAPPVSDTQPDQLEIPASEEEAWEILRNNKSYPGTLPERVNCAITPIDAEGVSPEDLQVMLNDLTACLMRVWDRPMTEQGVTMFRPKLTVYTGDIETACGVKPGDEPNAFYCGADQMLYYNYTLHTHPDTRSVGDTPFGIEAVMAHEFAHFLQGRTGIMGAYALLRYPEPESEFAYNLSRRTELQADCWTGEWVRANQRATGLDEAAIQAVSGVFSQMGGHTHGKGENRQGWYLRGSESTTIGTCNTWSASDDEVS
ncbi:MAG: hypothetical protein GXX86_11750 [Propionibacterium sp.]|nr:hypothetical protein [Propionibacterium sp.]